MPKETKNLYEMIETLWKPSIQLAETELKDMQAIMAKDGVKGDFQPWDWWYYADKVRSAKYALDETMIKPYFEVNNVREGVFTLLNKLFGIRFEVIENAPKYHPDMTAYKVTDGDSTLLGVLTLDLHPRATKRGGAWCSSFREQSYKDGKRVNIATYAEMALRTASQRATFMGEGALRKRLGIVTVFISS
ncbi:MAG: M3 family metallopeptidase, partial [Rikenellaceae bacterium]